MRGTLRSLWRRLALLAVAGLVVMVSPADAAAQSEAETDCYDAVVSARIVRQIPSPFPDCGDDCIVMSWPWFVEFDVKRVVSGQASNGPLLVLAVLHTSYRRDLGTTKWWLRRNTVGGFNLLRFAKEREIARCPEGTPPAAAYLTLGDGETLPDLLRKTLANRGREN